MRTINLNPVDILNASVQLTLRVASPWMGVLWISSLPLRLAQIYFFYQLETLEEPQHYVYYLWRLTAMTFAALLLSLYGRAVYTRAAHFAQNSARNQHLDPLKVPLADLVPYFYAALINELFFFATLFTVVLPPLFIIYGGVAAATSTGIGGPKLIDAVTAPFKVLRIWKSLLAVSFVYPMGLVLAFFNLYVLAFFVLWLCGALGMDISRWEYIFQPGKPLHAAKDEISPLDILRQLRPEQDLTFRLLLMGAWMMVEPFWLAANVALVQMARARNSGEDLKRWYRELKEGAAQ